MSRVRACHHVIRHTTLLRCATGLVEKLLAFHVTPAVIHRRKPRMSPQRPPLILTKETFLQSSRCRTLILTVCCQGLDGSLLPHVQKPQPLPPPLQHPLPQVDNVTPLQVTHHPAFQPSATAFTPYVPKLLHVTSSQLRLQRPPPRSQSPLSPQPPLPRNHTTSSRGPSPLALPGPAVTSSMSFAA